MQGGSWRYLDVRCSASASPQSGGLLPAATGLLPTPHAERQGRYKLVAGSQLTWAASLAGMPATPLAGRRRSLLQDTREALLPTSR